MKTLKNKILEGLKITSKTKLNDKSDEDIKTFKEFVDWYQNQIEIIDDNTFSVNRGKELYDKLCRFFKLNLNNRSNFNDFISKTEQYTNSKYKLYIYELTDLRNVKISCLDMSTSKEVSSLTIYSIKIENVKVRLRNESKDKEQEEILMNAFKHILFNK